MPVCPQSKSLAGDSSLLFSPPSIIKDTLPEEVLEEVFALPKSASGAIGITVSTRMLFFCSLHAGSLFLRGNTGLLLLASQELCPQNSRKCIAVLAIWVGIACLPVVFLLLVVFQFF